MQRHSLLLCLAVFLCMGDAATAGDADGTWGNYKERFISPDGRVIDYFQDSISHSEGQGYAMLLAVAFNDREIFEKLWRWTNDNLQVRRSDPFCVWMWGRRFNGEWRVIDYNTATDGDVLIALALLQARKKWKDEKFLREGAAIVRNLRIHLTVENGGRQYLLPGYYGFKTGDTFILNPSYFIPSAYHRFAEVDDRGFWEKLRIEGLALLQQARFGELRLPPDWLTMHGEQLSVRSEKSRFFGSDAVRIPLYLLWQGDDRPLAWFRGILDLYRRIGYLPLNIDLIDGAVSKEEAPAGYYAIFARLAERLGDTQLGRRLMEKGRRQLPAEKFNYYSNTLFLLSTAEIAP